MSFGWFFAGIVLAAAFLATLAWAMTSRVR